MKKKIFNTYNIIGVSLFALFILLILLLNIDKERITETYRYVGLSSFNDLIDYKYNKGWDVLSDILLYSSIALVVAAAGLGLYQLIKRKSLFKVDLDIILFGVFFVFVAIFWLLFDHVIVINYRPILIDGNFEVSFPSTHILIVTFVFMSLHGFSYTKLDNKALKIASLILAIVVIILISFGRVLSGMHYITDAIGGVILGLSFYFLTFGLYKTFKKDEDEAITEPITK